MRLLYSWDPLSWSQINVILSYLIMMLVKQVTLKICTVESTLKSMCLSFRGPVMWNKLHTDLKNSTSVNMFKKRYKTFLVSEYAVT